MQTPRKTVIAMSVAALLVLGTGVVAATTILDLRVPGFTTSNADSAAPTPTTTGAGPTAGVTAPAADDARAPASPATGPRGTAAPAAGPAPAGPIVAANTAAGAPAPGGAASEPTPGPTSPPPTSPPAPAPHEDDHVTPPTTIGGTVPPVPAGCREPEWDSEHHVWHCATGADD